MFCKYFAEVRRLFAFRFFENLEFRTFKHFTSKNRMNTKPPNILVYTGNNCPQKFKEVEESILKCVRADSYIVYHLLASEINESPWMENSLLLVVSSDIVENAVAEVFDTYLKNFGNILLICSKIDISFFGIKCLQILDKNSLIRVDFQDIGKVFILRGKYSYDFHSTVLFKDNFNKSLVQKITRNENILITSEIYLDKGTKISEFSPEYNSDNRLQILKYILTVEFGLGANGGSIEPNISPGYFICDKVFQLANIMNSLKLDDISSDEFVFYECKFRNADEQIKMPIYFYHKDLFQPLNFNETLYFSNLHTDVFGHHFVYFPVITSTMEAAKQLSEYEGIVIAAGYQTNGKGRRSNKWISPKGCAMFTLHFTVPLCSNLGKKITLLQHIASLAVVHGIKSQQMYKDLELKIKWPNDIYYNKTKLGGLLVTTVIQSNLVHVDIGWGINVANSHPTSCLNDAIDRHNSENSSSLYNLHIEQIIAFTVSQMEYFVKDFIEFGPENFLMHYYLYWMHSNQKVTVTILNKQGTVIGVDEYGFLKIKMENDEILIFQPDGNRFDIMKNLIHSV